MVRAAEALGYRVNLTAINHWERAIQTHSRNHPAARHLCASLDSLNPRHYHKRGKVDILWASPSCRQHSLCIAGRKIIDQDRATAFCVCRWAEELLPKCIILENVPEFVDWAPLGTDDRPLKSRKGEIFRAFVNMLVSIGYKVEWRILCAADYGDPTRRYRMVLQAVLGRREIVWPERTHASNNEIQALRKQGDLFQSALLKPWVTAGESVIDWSIPTVPISQRKKPLTEKTMRQLVDGAERFSGEPFLVAMEHGGRVLPTSVPLPTVTTAKGGAFGVAFLVEYYGNGSAKSLNRPLPTVTCKDRFGLVTVAGKEMGFRMLRPHEYAAAHSFPREYEFCGTVQESVKQIGNSVPILMAEAVAKAALQNN